jgi:hypothetical protein
MVSQGTHQSRRKCNALSPLQLPHDVVDYSPSWMSNAMCCSAQGQASLYKQVSAIQSLPLNNTVDKVLEKLIALLT